MSALGACDGGDSAMKKISVLLLALAILCSVLCLFVSADGGHLTDHAGLFTDEQIAELESAIRKAESGSKCDYFIITKVDEDPFAFSSNYELKDAELSAAGINKRGDNTVLLIIDRGDGRYCYHIYTHGNSYDYIDDAEFDDIWYAIDGIEDGEFLDNSLIWLKKSSEAYDESAENTVIIFIVVWVIVTVAAVVITISIVVSRYKMKIKPTNYPLDRYCKMKVTNDQDLFRGTFVTRRRIPRSNGGGHGGRGGGGISSGGSRARR